MDHSVYSNKSGTNKEKADNSPAIILVEPQLGENIGASARVMYNFGCSDLRIVNPRDGWPNEKARAMSAGATHIIDNTIIYDDLKSALHDITSLYAVSARRRDMVKPGLTPDNAISCVSGGNIAFMFGPERSGLTNRDISYADSIITIQANEEYPSLNLAQSVAVICYEYYKTDNRANPNRHMENIASRGEVLDLVEHLESELRRRGFYKSPAMESTMINNMRNIFTRMDLTTQESRSLRGIIRCLSDYQN